MLTKTRTVRSAVALAAASLSVIVSMAASQSAAASPIDLLGQAKTQMQIQHQNYCQGLMGQNIADYGAAQIPGNTAGQQALAMDRVTAINAGCPFV